nr:immunoglobulin light chain junction region [Macaca mulatta]
CQQRNSWTF